MAGVQLFSGRFASCVSAPKLLTRDACLAAGAQVEWDLVGIQWDLERRGWDPAGISAIGPLMAAATPPPLMASALVANAADAGTL